MVPGKKNAGPGGTIVFVDESGFSEAPVIRRTWAPRGRTPVLRPRLRHWRRMSAIGALAYRSQGKKARVFLSLRSGPVVSEEVVRFLNHLARHVRGPAVIVWDRLNIHRSFLVRAWFAGHSRFQVEFLPAYAPELNPVEGLWSWLKGSQLANVCEDSLDPILQLVRRGTRRVRRRPDLLQGFLEKSGLSF
ncbi:MAG: IS630 family transposase [Candidatus Eisenbacteria bacterium]